MSDSLRVLYLAPRARRPGDLSRYSFLDEEMRALAAAGIDVYALCDSEFPSVDAGRLHLRSVPVETLSGRLRCLRFLYRCLRRIPIGNLREWRKLYRAARIEQYAAEVIGREKIDLVHSYFGAPGGYGGMLAALVTGRPLVASLRGADVNMVPALGYGARRDRSFDRAIKRLLSTADRTVFVSEFLQQQGCALGADLAKSLVILKGVRLDLFSDTTPTAVAREAAGLDDRPMILSVSGLVRIKGIDDVLDALRLVRARGGTFHYVVCGEGPERSALAARVEELGLAGDVTFVGRVPRDTIRSYFRAANVLVHGARIEASGNVLLEAMASGVPVVCTDAGGPAEYVIDQVCGFVVPVGDIAAMADRISLLLAKPALATQLGLQGRRHAEASLSYERMISETISLYQSVVAPE